jgi:hypothetical protein
MTQTRRAIARFALTGFVVACATTGLAGAQWDPYPLKMCRVWQMAKWT